MKKNYLFLFILATMLLSFEPVAWAGKKQYAKGTVAISPKSIGSGTVYVTQTDNASSGNTFCQSGEGEKKVQQFYFYANPDANSEFEGWYDEEGDLVSTSSKYARKIKSPTSRNSADGINERTFTAKFRKKPVVCNLTLETSSGGSYTCKYINGTAISVTGSPTQVEAQDIILSASPASGKRFFGWYTLISGEKRYLSTEKTDTLSFVEEQTIGCDFVDESLPTFAIKSELDGPNSIKLYTSLLDAVNVANNNVANSSGTNKIVALVANGTLTEDVTIPSGVTLLIPFSDNYDCYREYPLYLSGWKRQSAEGVDNSSFADAAKVDRTLTIAANKTLTVNGSLSVSAPRWCVYWKLDQSGNVRMAGKYGCIIMESNSKIVVNGDNSFLYCWGRIIGSGEIVAENKSTVYESFVFTDWREENKIGSLAVSSNIKCFAINQYFIQDIQVPITYKYGSTGKLAAGMWYYSGEYPGKGNMNFVGKDDALFLVKNDTSFVKKYYTLNDDRLNYDFKGETGLGDFSLVVSGISNGSFNSYNRVFTATHNWTFNVLSGKCKLAIDMSLAPGAHLNIEKGAELEVQDGYSLYACDSANWGLFAPERKIIPLSLPSNSTGAPYTYHLKASVASTKRDYPAFRDADHMGLAEIKIDGTLSTLGGTNKALGNISGFYTTEAGAKIYSLNNGGTIVYRNGKGTQPSIPYAVGDGQTSPSKVNVTVKPAKLRNSDLSFYNTENASALSKSTYMYFKNESKGWWKKVSTVTFNRGDQTFVDSLAEGDVIVVPEIPERQGYNFLGWDNTPATTMGTIDLIYNAIWEKLVISINVKPEETEIKSSSDAPVAKEDNEESTYTLSQPMNAEVVTIQDGAIVKVGNSVSLSVVDTFVINASANSSGQLKCNNNVDVSNSEVFFDFTINNGDAYDRAKQNWYAFAVPFEVDPYSLLYKTEGGTFEPCSLGVAIDIIYYDGETRANYGPNVNAWKYVEELGDKTLKPGVFYMAAFSKKQYASTVRFPKKSGAALISSNEVPTSAHPSSVTTDANWNGIANPNLYYSTLESDTVTLGQIYEWTDDDESNYSAVPLADALSVGKPIFIQTVVNKATAVQVGNPSSAPKRLLATTSSTKSALVDVRITSDGNSKYSDRLFIAMDENAAGRYTIGADLVKAGMATKRAQMWVNNYGQKLCLNTIAPIDDIAEYELGIYVPTTGDYTIQQASVNDGTLYLTEDGEAIWNLSDTPCTLSICAGTNSTYGLRWVNTNVGVVTDLTEAAAKASQGETEKVILNDHLLIINNGRIYNAQGTKLK